MHFCPQAFALALIIFTEFLCYFLTSASWSSSLERFELDGLGCKSPVFIVDNAFGFSDIACAYKCSKIPACAAISYNPFTYECKGCFMFDTNVTGSEEGKLWYGLLNGAKDNLVNVAYRKKAYQSSSSWADYHASKGVDGNPTTFFQTQNSSGTSNWWYVDLHTTYILTEVKVVNRLGCCRDRAKDIRVLLGKSLDDLTEVAYSPGQIDDIWTVPLQVNTAARYVKLVHNGHALFHLGEVQVFARAASI